MAETVWERRWRDLKFNGFSHEQAQRVYDLLEDARAFGTETIAGSAQDKLTQVYGERAVETYVFDATGPLGEPYEALVTRYAHDDGRITLAFRHESQRTWGPPLEGRRG